jgi:AraC-like DNA-binding protein
VDAGQIFSVRRLATGGLDALHEDSEVRTPHLRISLRTGRNIATDYGLLNRAVPFMDRMQRPQVSVVLAGEGRADEQGRRVWLSANSFAVSDGGATRGGIHAYAGVETKQLLVEWDPAVFGAPFDRELAVANTNASDRARLEAAAERAVAPPTSTSGIAEVLAMLRSLGLPLDRVDPPSSRAAPAELCALHAAVASALSSLDRFPAIDDFAGELGWNARRIHRGIRTLAERFTLPWNEWRWVLRSQRMMAATRLLSAPGATTDAVAQLTGFRSPTSLCHAFAKAGLPSPGALARAARRDVLDAWTDVA